MARLFFYGDDTNVPFSFIQPTRWVGPIGLPYATSAMPGKYLQFALEDLKDPSDRGVVNAFGNVKRSLHVTVDMLLNQYGLFNGYRRANFPEKLGVLDLLGILPTSIMKNINVERNLIEHEYTTPERRRVEEAVDVAQLIELAISRLLGRTPIEFVIRWRDPARHAVMRIEPSECEIRVHSLTARGRYRTINGLRVLNGPLRTFTDGTLMEDVKVGEKPFVTISLTKDQQPQWSPVLREVVTIQRGDALGGVDEPSEGYITTTVSLPMPLERGQLMSQWLDEVWQSRVQPNRGDATEPDGSK